MGCSSGKQNGVRCVRPEATEVKDNAEKKQESKPPPQEEKVQPLDGTETGETGAGLQTESEDIVAASPAGRDRRSSLHFECGVKEDISQCVGDTPMVWLHNCLPPECKAKICVKLESENPAKSVKDRLAAAIIETAERNGSITPGVSTLIEATSGNTGIALAMLGAAKGYRVILTMPEAMSMERRCLLKAYGAELVLTPSSKGVKGAVIKAEQLAQDIEGAVLTKQFESSINAQAHEETTGPEIWKATQGEFDAFVVGVGTGGTLTGCARYFKAQGSDCEIVAVEPEESAVLNGGRPGPHKIQGIGAGFKPHVLDMELVDTVISVSSEAAITRARELPRTEGLLVGISSGAACEAAIQLGCKKEYEGKTIVTLLASYGERYLTTPLFSDLVKEAAALPVCPEEECESE